MIKYVAGFLFSEDKQEVLLIRKIKPEWQKGLLNGVGGKIEEFDKIPLDAMIREFEEEAGVHITNWKSVVTLMGIRDKIQTYSVDFFSAINDKIYQTEAQTEEALVIADTFNLPENVIFNLRWLIPFCLDNTLDKPALIYDIKGN